MFSTNVDLSQGCENSENKVPSAFGTVYLWLIINQALLSTLYTASFVTLILDNQKTSFFRSILFLGYQGSVAFDFML